MDGEQKSLLVRPQQLHPKPRYAWLWVLLGFVVIEILLIAVSHYSGKAIIYIRAYPPQGHQKKCSSKNFRSQTLKLVREIPFADIFGVDTIKKFESSDITGDPSGDGLYCVFDNSFSIARIGHAFRSFLSKDGPLKDEAFLEWTGSLPNEDSDFEFITFNSSSGRFIVGRESEVVSDGTLHSRTYDVTFEESRTIVHDSCVSDFAFSHRNKGFEGAVVVELHGKSMLVGLCEGNFCKGKQKGRESGNGRLVVMEREVGSTCRYKTAKIINLPRKVDFEDYSAIAVWKGSRVGIASQKNAAIFVGDLNPENLTITDGRVYDLPRNDNCEIKYCNLEGLYFLKHDLVVTVTDSMKRKQDFRCREKDESIQVFQIPPS